MNEVKTGTIVRTATLFFALANQILVTAGKPVIPIKDEELQNFASLLILIVSSLVAWWKNNSFTNKAIKADDYLEELKQEESK